MRLVWRTCQGSRREWQPVTDQPHLLQSGDGLQIESQTHRLTWPGLHARAKHDTGKQQRAALT